MSWPSPTNLCPENKKVQKNQKQQNKKEKNYPSQPATTTSPVLFVATGEFLSSP